jgi:hypothetical protein
MLKTRFRRWAQVMAAWRSAGILSSGCERTMHLSIFDPLHLSKIFSGNFQHTAYLYSNSVW